MISGVSFINAHVAFASADETKIVRIKTFESFFHFLPWADAPLVYVRACGTLCCCHCLVSTQTFRKALTASVDICAVIKSPPSVVS